MIGFGLGVTFINQVAGGGPTPPPPLNAFGRMTYLIGQPGVAPMLLKRAENTQQE